ncbi:MAG: hypothetical protein EOO06_19695 [Chitinophagaceae bacterium]|nr:MAG: hypothetical protein EOO06_19695 [Chitinophagaceae bacterium]
MKTLKKNYTSVCHYCGLIFENNRSTAKYCEGHNAMYHLAGGPRLETKDVLGIDGVLFDVDRYLDLVYNDGKEKNQEGWSKCYHKTELLARFGYKGPFPKGSEYLVLGSYVLRRTVDIYYQFKDEYAVKPFTLLTKEERATKVFDGKRKDAR